MAEIYLSFIRTVTGVVLVILSGITFYYVFIRKPKKEDDDENEKCDKCENN